MSDREQEQGDASEQERMPSVAEVLLSSVHLMVTLGVQAIAARDTDGARLAIDSIRALLPLLERVLPADSLGQYRQALAAPAARLRRRAGSRTGTGARAGAGGGDAAATEDLDSGGDV